MGAMKGVGLVTASAVFRVELNFFILQSFRVFSLVGKESM